MFLCGLACSLYALVGSVNGFILAVVVGAKDDFVPWEPFSGQSSYAVDVTAVMSNEG